jgi:hypothetical protein
MDHFCTKLALPTYNKPRSCVSKIHTHMVMVWFGNVWIFNKVEFPSVLIYVTSEKIRKKAWGQHRRARCPWLGRLLIILAPFLLIVWFLWSDHGHLWVFLDLSWPSPPEAEFFVREKIAVNLTVWGPVVKKTGPNSPILNDPSSTLVIIVGNHKTLYVILLIITA